MTASTPPAGRRRVRQPTATATFGSGRREAHDASAFYDRFVAPEVTTDSTLAPPGQLDVIHTADARDMTMVADNSVALVVTSPPYFAGKQYEESLGVDGVPATYFEYLDLLRDVFSECKRVLEPGGRIAVNVANLGRRPYRSLAGDVTQVLSDLGLLLRGEVVWWKGRAAGGSCAWGTFQRPANPVLRDVTERVVIASKGRFDRALTPAERAARGLPSVATVSRDEFMEATTDLWEIAPESATRVGHPAPFPVELPARLIELYTYRDDVVLDPFMGSGSTAVAAVRAGRHFIGFDTDADYVAAALARVDEVRRMLASNADPASSTRVAIPAVPPADDLASPLERSLREGRQAREVAQVVLTECGFTDLRTDVKRRGTGVELSVVANDAHGHPWAFDVSGGFTNGRTGLRRADTLARVLATAAVVHASLDDPTELPLVILSTDLPTTGSAGAQALGTLSGPGRPITAALDLLDPGAHEMLRTFARDGHPDRRPSAAR